MGAYESEPELICPDIIGPPEDPEPDGVVDGFDYLQLLGQWGPCADCNDCSADFTNENGTCRDCVVNGFDMLYLMANWGPCQGFAPSSVPPEVEDCYKRFEENITLLQECIEWVMEHEDFFPEE